jgi:predicted nucleic acid-binding protein
MDEEVNRFLVDTSVWIDHLRSPSEQLIGLLKQRRALVHSAVVGELACGYLLNRNEFLSSLSRLPAAKEASPDDVLELIEKRKLYGKGLGWIDAQLIASAILSDVLLLTYDKRLNQTFVRLG